MSNNIDRTKVTAAYWYDCLAEEKELAPLMGWALLSMPDQPTEQAWIFGSNEAWFTSEVGPQVTHGGIKPIPRWRRDASALGLLLEKVPANIRWDPIMNVVHVWFDMHDGPALCEAAAYIDHPTNGHALRKALVRLAITYLTARNRESDALRHRIQGEAQ